MVTHQLQVERRTGKVRQSETDVLPLCHATNRWLDHVIDYVSGLYLKQVRPVRCQIHGYLPSRSCHRSNERHKRRLLDMSKCLGLLRTQPRPVVQPKDNGQTHNNKKSYVCMYNNSISIDL